jgi:crotonobetainyl-CoA hydratase
VADTVSDGPAPQGSSSDEAPGALTDRRGNILVVTINRPDARNAVNAAVSIGVGDALQQAQDDPEIWAVVITGAGDKSFCAGADLKAISRRENIYHPDHPEWGFAGYVQHFIDKPTIAAVNGTALGGGTELALASDLAVAVSSAKFGLPEVKRGLIAAAGGVFRIVDQLPRKIAMQLLFTGEPITADEALRWGLINQIVSEGEPVLDAAVALAERITANAPLAVQASKRVAVGADAGTITAETLHWERSDRETKAVFRSEDAVEGPLAFAQKRQPVWKAR